MRNASIIRKFQASLLCAAFLFCVGCGKNMWDKVDQNDVSPASSSTDEDDTVTVTSSGTDAGSTTIYAFPDETVFTEINATGELSSPITFPTFDNTSTAAMDHSFSIAKTETTYEQWESVRTWALAHGYTFAGTGQRGCADSGALGYASTSVGQPATRVYWRDAIVWCNALTEYYNAMNGAEKDLACVYYADSSYATPLRAADTSAIDVSSSGLQDTPYIKATVTGNTSMGYCNANGFRLPSSEEWLFAARYAGTTDPGSAFISSDDLASLTAGYYWTPYDYASGATADVTDLTATMSVAVADTYSGSTETPFQTKSVGSKKANALGLYDMSGNVWEWCFEWSAAYSTRVRRGGSFRTTQDAMTGDPELSWEQVSSSDQFSPAQNIYNNGFRFARSL